MTEEGQEGRNAFQQGRNPDFSKFPRRPSAVRIWLMAPGRARSGRGGPVLVGTAAAVERARSASRAIRRRADRGVFLQIGTNLANDYSDAKRGADTVDRLARSG